MREIQISMSELRQNLGSFVNRVAYGGDRIILVAHGEPKAAIISIEDLGRLQQLSHEPETSFGRYSTGLVAADLLQERTREWQEQYRVEPEDTVDTLNQIRTDHDDELNDLR
jgi:prevent-host-death family protein